jgi:hypothetical protein
MGGWNGSEATFRAVNGTSISEGPGPGCRILVYPERNQRGWIVRGRATGTREGGMKVEV